MKFQLVAYISIIFVFASDQFIAACVLTSISPGRNLPRERFDQNLSNLHSIQNNLSDFYKCLLGLKSVCFSTLYQITACTDLKLKKILSWHASAVKLFNNLSFLKTKKRFICKHMLGIK